MKKFDKDNYRFINLSETDYTQFSVLELDDRIATTKEILSMTKGKIKQTPMNIALVAGLLGVRGGEFKSINILGAKWKAGNTTKEERKLVKKVFFTAKFYYLFKVVITLISKKESQFDELNPTLAEKIGK